MRKVRVSAVWMRLWRARTRLFVAVVALATAVQHRHGWFGWALGVFAATGIILFEFSRWWDYLRDGKRESQESEPRLSGSTRFREPGVIAVRLLSVGDRPELVARRLRVMTNLEDAQIAGLMRTAPANLPDLLSLRSAEHVVDALRHAGAESQLLIDGILPARRG